jgi:hypothetical protein
MKLLTMPYVQTMYAGVQTMSLILPRRQFLIGGASSLIVAPTIVRASSLMDINRLGNRVIIGYRRKGDERGSWFQSSFNAFDSFKSDDFRMWTAYHSENEYRLVRRDDVVNGYYASSSKWYSERVLSAAREWYNACPYGQDLADEAMKNLHIV